MFDIGIWELLVLSVVALIVIGPKEFPIFLRTIGRMVSRIKGVARDFQGTMEDVATDMELDKIRKANQDINSMGHIDIMEPEAKPSKNTEVPKE